MFKFFKRKVKQQPFENLNIGLIEQYSMIIKKKDLEYWLIKGWVESPKFTHFHYAPEKDETVVLGKPKTINEVGAKMIVGHKIIKYCQCLGSYGMGGPGFFGLLLENTEGNREYLVYAVWASGEYILLDGRVVLSHAKYNKQFHPWVSKWANPDTEDWDDLSPLIEGAIIEKTELFEDKLIIKINKSNSLHSFEFYRYDDRLPPHGSGKDRGNAFDEGVIGDYIVFQQEGAVLHV